MNLIMLICLWGVNTFFYNKHVLNFIFSAYYMLSSNIKASQTFTSPSSRLSGCLMDLCVIELICFALWPLYPFIFRSSFPLSHFTSIKIFQDSQNVSFSNDESDFLVWRRFPKKIRRWGAETKLFSYWNLNLYIYNNKKNCGPTIIYNDELAPRTFLIENPIFLYALIRVYFFTLMNRLLHLRNLLREGANLKPSWPTDGATSYNRYNYNVQTDLRATRMNQLPRIAGPSALF